MRSAGRSGWLLGAAAVALVLPGCAAVPNLGPKPAPRAAQSYEAGARAAAGLERAVRSGALPRAELDAGVRRVLRWRLALARAG